jgi:hypothetical protein
LEAKNADRTTGKDPGNMEQMAGGGGGGAADRRITTTTTTASAGHQSIYSYNKTIIYGNSSTAVSGIYSRYNQLQHKEKRLHI